MAPADELEIVLAAQARELRGLSRLLREEEQGLLRANRLAVTALGERKAEIVRRLAELESRREALLRALSEALGTAPRRLTLSELLRRLPRPTRALSDARDDLRTALHRALAQSARNEFLVERTLGWLRGLMGQLATSLAPAPTYAVSGRPVQPGLVLHLLDRQA